MWLAWDSPFVKTELYLTARYKWYEGISLVFSELSMSKWNNFFVSYSFYSLEQYLFLDSKLCWLCFKPQSNSLQTFVEVWCLEEAWPYKKELMIQTNPRCYDLHNASFTEFHCPPVLTDGISKDIIPGEFMPRLA